MIAFREHGSLIFSAFRGVSAISQLSDTANTATGIFHLVNQLCSLQRWYGGLRLDQKFITGQVPAGFQHFGERII